MRIDGYIRVSRVNGRSGETFISPRVQRDKIKAFAKLHGHTIAAWHEDLDEPGSKVSRPGFQEAIGRVERGKTSGIAVARLDRFARSVADAASAIRRIRDAGGELLSVEDNFDSSTPMGKFAMHMILALGELELDRIRENWATAQRLAVERGVHVASKTPTGYRRRDDGRLEPNEHDAAAIADLFRARAAGVSYGELSRLLEERRVVGPYGNRHWTTGAIRNLLSNRAYLGEARSGRFVNKDAHPAIVTESEWHAAQGVRSAPVPRVGQGALLSGLLRCSGCRYVMKPDTMVDRDGSKIRLYRCRGDHAVGRCPEPSSVLGRVIEPHVEELFFGGLPGILAYGESDHGDADEVRRRRDDAERALEEWVTMPAATRLRSDLYEAGLELRQAELDEAQREVEELDGDDQLAPLRDADLRERYRNEMDIAEQRRLLTLGLDAIMIRRGRVLDDRVLLIWRGQAPDDFPARGRRVPLAPFSWPDDRPGDARVMAA
jgi:site-specific DNA recombinase